MSTRPRMALTITKSDIAELAGVGRSTVSNWISRPCRRDHRQPSI
jgi:transcriptional regulator with XRE-family HTH domain